MATTNQLTKKLRKMSLENDELTLKLAASRDIKKNQEKPDDSDELVQLRDENSKLKSQFEMSCRKVCFQSDEIQELTATTNELNKKLWKMSLKNDELILKLAASRDIASTNIDDFHKTELQMKKEITELKDQLNSKEKILDEKEATLNSTLQAKKVADEKVKEMHKSQLELELAHQKNWALTNKAAKATKTEGESMNSGATKTEKRTKGNWVGKLFDKRKTRQSQNQDGYAKLLETTGLKMVERAKILQDNAENIKAKGKALKKKAKAIQK
ncbi:hypothetical protein DAPPUDRAFT_102088 [Daphnia pulex]|uniref:Uncharacterized protein n=1 Tax=Daphnia pulex TaxID=6669 RepID=E9GFC4_DAPPU|nr:hypothetical protein DAPPUDRAFT_102088 [Daphnia pulex]|eukprot:EFX81836.1 hypothetical protein DAPPUDRAFT_102088 [Daphnia pulex]